MEWLNSFREGIDSMLNLFFVNFFLLNLSSPFYHQTTDDKSSFKEAVIHILKKEGGLSNDKNDKGGITNYGISLNFVKTLIKNNPALINEFDLNNNKVIDSYDIIKINKTEAEYIYKKFWWDKYNYGKLNSQPLANKIFDMAINMGPAAASSILIEACEALNKNNSFETSPALNKDIINYINSLSNDNKYELLNNLRKLSIIHYINIVKKNPSQEKFLRGWIRRAKN